MAEPHVITAFSKKRAELSGDIERTQHQLQDMIRDLEHRPDAPAIRSG